jgi:hypothetical protein
MIRSKLKSAIETIDKKPRAQKLAFIFGLIVSLSIVISLVIQAHIYSPYSTDDVAQQVLLAETDLNDGRAVKATASGYAIKFPYYIFLNHILPNTNLSIFITNTTLIAAGIILTFLAFYWLRRYVAFSVITFVVLMAAMLTLQSSSINPNYRNIEVGISFLIVAATVAFLYKGFLQKKNMVIKSAVALLSAVGLGFFWFGDPMFLYFTGVPLLLLTIADLFINRNHKKRPYIVLGIMGASYLFYKLWAVVFAALFEWEVRSTIGGLISFNELVPTLKIGWDALILLGIAKTELLMERAQLPLLDTLRIALGIVFVVGGLAASALLFIVELVRNKAKANLIVLFFSALPFIMLGIFIVSGTIVDVGAVRYLLLLPIILAFNVAVLVKNHPTGKIIAMILATVLVALVVTLACFSVIRKPDSVEPNRVDRDIAAILQAENLTKGYAPSGMSLYFNYISNHTLNTVSIYCTPDKMGIYFVLLDEAKVVQPADRTFYIHYPNAISNRCDRLDVVSRIGEPDYIINAEAGIEIMVYNRDIKNDIKVK